MFKQDLIPGMQGLTETLTLPIYNLKLELSDDLRQVEGDLEILFSNTTGEKLNEIVLRLYPNALGHSLKVSQLTVDKLSVLRSLEQAETVLRIFLPSELDVAEQTSIQLSFKTELFDEAIDLSYGRLGRYSEVLSLSHAYPILSAYESGNWLTSFPSSQGDPVVSEAAFYHVQVTAPPDQTLIATGTRVDQIRDASTQTACFVTGPVREFFLASATDFVEFSYVSGETVITMFTPQRFDNVAESSLQITAQALDRFSLLSPYPYKELDIVVAPMRASGIEFPGIFTLANSLVANPGNSLESVIVHEAAHQWSYNLVGSDQVLEPWLDEALAQYLTLLYHETYNSDPYVRSYLEFWNNTWQDASNDAQSIGSSVASYDANSYSPIIYGKGLYFFRALAEFMGKDVLERGLRDYYQANAWQFVTGDDLKQSLEQSCNCDLAEIFKTWVGE